MLTRVEWCTHVVCVMCRHVSFMRVYVCVCVQVYVYICVCACVFCICVCVCMCDVSFCGIHFFALSIVEARLPS